MDVLSIPAEHVCARSRRIHVPADVVAFATALAGFLLATSFYGLRMLDPERSAARSSRRSTGS